MKRRQAKLNKTSRLPTSCLIKNGSDQIPLHSLYKNRRCLTPTRQKCNISRNTTERYKNARAYIQYRCTDVVAKADTNWGYVNCCWTKFSHAHYWIRLQNKISTNPTKYVSNGTSFRERFWRNSRRYLRCFPILRSHWTKKPYRVNTID